MTLKLMLDTNVLARICHPTQYRDVQGWFRSILERGARAPEILISVIADYELRRKLLDEGAAESLLQLGELARSLRYVPLTAEASRRAAEMRHVMGKTARVSDADLLMAAQAEIEGAVLVTNDHLIQRIPGIMAKDWNEVDLG